MQLIVIIPTNRSVQLDYLEPLIEKGARFIVVDDTEGSVEVPHPAFQVFDWGDRRRRLGELDEWFPRRNGSCRSYGFYLAWCESNPDDIIVALDDDCELDEHDFVAQLERTLGPESRPVAEVSGLHLNILDLYENIPDGLFPRGFPYSERGGYPGCVSNRNQEAAPLFNLGLWRGAFDVNGIDKIMGPEWIHPQGRLRQASTLVAPGNLVSACSMNMHFRAQVIPAAYQLPMHVPVMDNWVIDRYGDIWGGFILKVLMDKRGDWMSVGAPMIHHTKAHGFERNAWQEHICHMVNDEFIEVLLAAADEVPSTDYLEMMAALREGFARRSEGTSSLLRGYLEHLVRALEAWTTALARGR